MTRTNRHLHLPFCGLLALILVACAPTSPKTSYYSLLGAQAHEQGGNTASALVLSIGPVTLPDLLRQPQIATGGENGRYELSDSHRWAGEVDRDFAYAVAEQLGARLGTDQALLYPVDRRLAPRCQVALDILALDGIPGKTARLIVRWTLLDPTDGKAPVTRRSSFSRQPAAADHAAWVEAQRANIGLLAEEIAVAITSASFIPAKR